MTSVLSGILSALLTAVIAQLGLIFRARHDLRKNRDDSLEHERQNLYAGVLTLLRDRLFGACRECIRAGEIDTEELENISALYAAYHALGGNGTGTTLYDRVKALPGKEESL